MQQHPLSPDAMHTLQQYDFPGNIRELRNIIERACLLSDSYEIHHDCLQIQAEQDDSFTQLIPRSTEREADLLKHFKGNRKELAKYLGISERTLYRKLAQLKDS